MRGTARETAFNDAVQRYASGDVWLVGVLISGARSPDDADLKSICEAIGRQPGSPEVHLLGFYVPFHKDKWRELIYASPASA